MPWRKDRFCWDALVLAGGRSLRMGTDKASLVVEGVPLLQLQVRRLREAGASTVWISHASGPAPSPSRHEDIRWIADDAPGLGPWPGMRRALQASDADALLVLAVDLPAMTPCFLRRVANPASHGVGRIPETPHGLEPLCALYPLPAAAVASEAIATDGEPSPRRIAIKGIREGWMQVMAVDDADAPALVNWNRPGDWSPVPPGTGA